MALIFTISSFEVAVPGEFVGKYLISGVQAMRMCDDPQLRQTLELL